MDVVDARPDLVRIAEVIEGIQKLHVGARGLDGDHVRIHGRNGGHDVVELRIAHVGVDLGVVGHTIGRDAEALHRPVQVLLPLRPTQRQPLAQRRLVDLDDADAGLFQIQHLLADGQRQLPAGRGTRLIIAHERPVQHRYRTGEHALHRALRERLCMLRPGHRHRMRTADVTEQDGRLHAARPIGLHPAEAAERIAFQLLAKVLHHVVALGLAMHQHVQPQRFLLAHTAGHLGPHGLLVGRRINLASLELTTCLADFSRLREGTDGGGGKHRQLEAGPLALRPHRVGALARRCGLRGAPGQRRLHRRVVDTR